MTSLAHLVEKESSNKKVLSLFIFRLTALSLRENEPGNISLEQQSMYMKKRGSRS